MKVSDLEKTIKENKKLYSDFSDWEIYTEQITETDKKYKKLAPINNGQGWEFIIDEEQWEYFKCCGFNTTFPTKKIFTVNVNY